MPRYLVIQLARFGDIIQTGRLLRSLVRTGETHLCVDRSLVALAERLYPDCTVHGIAAHGGNPATVLSHNYYALSALSECSFTTVYNLNYSDLNFALASLFAPETLRGYRTLHGQPLRERWIRMAFRWIRRRRFAPINLVDFWGLLAPDPIPPHQVHPIATPKGKGLGVVLAGRQARRSLPPEILASLVTALFERLGGCPVFLLGTAAERPTGRELLNHLPARVLGKTSNLAGRTDWTSLIDAVSDLDCLLSPDTGTMHLGASLGVPVCGTFLSSAWAWETGPYGSGHRVWQAIPSCAPCVESSPCSGSMECLAPFRSHLFLTTLAGQKDFLPPDLLALNSTFDALGLTWTSPLDPMAPQRTALRASLAEYQGFPASIARIPLLADREGLLDTLYTESDWLLPDHPSFSE